MLIFIDDEREVPNAAWQLARTSAEAIELLEDQRAADAEAPEWVRISVPSAPLMRRRTRE